MKRLVLFLNATLIGGLVFLVPLGITIWVLGESIQFVKGVIRPISEWIPAELVAGGVVADVIVGAGIIAVCFFVGLFVSTRPGRNISERIEDLTLRRVPGYNLIKSATRGMVGLETESDLSVALANIENAWMLSFIVERHADGLLTVFVPSAPTPAAGTIYLMAEDRVRVLNVPVSLAVSCIMRLGIGSRELMAKAGPINLKMSVAAPNASE